MQSSTGPAPENSKPNYLLVHPPSELDLRELFTLGLTTKRDGTEIGHKGSGMKFALALIYRLGSLLLVRVGPRDLKSVAVTENIRGHKQRIFRLEGTAARQPSRIETHNTDQAGADTWTEPWFALHEFVQNALDEGGSWWIVEKRWPSSGRRQSSCSCLPLANDYHQILAPRDARVSRVPLEQQVLLRRQRDHHDRELRPLRFVEGNRVDQGDLVQLAEIVGHLSLLGPHRDSCSTGPIRAISPVSPLNTSLS